MQARLTYLFAIIGCSSDPMRWASHERPLTETPIWENRTPALGPPAPRYSHAIAYDSTRGVTVLFGGYRNGVLGDLWEWDGAQWTQRTQSGPGARASHAMAYDSARGVTVLFGGGNATSALGDTWEWDGVAWTQRATTGPSPRGGHALAYDSARGVTVLFGGSSGAGETWEWDGNNWALRATTGPSPRYSHAMAYDSTRHVTVLYGGDIGGFGQSDTWEWDGTSWTRRVTNGGAGIGRYGHAMAYDTARGRTVLFGGTYDDVSDNPEIWNTWEWDGTSWARYAVAGPTERFFVAMAYDGARSRSVVFGGISALPFIGGLGPYGDTWLWDGASWSTNATSPSARDTHAMAYESIRGRTVLFGGEEPGTYLFMGDTWEWDGAVWTQVASIGPSGRMGHAMAYDSARGRTVLFGGVNNNVLGDTWEWDGALWAQVASTGPPARAAPAMAFDEARQRTVLFGGGYCTSTCVIYGDTWEWDGVTWMQVAANGPTARAEHAMVYDSARARTVLFGGSNGTPMGDLGDTWEWDGVAWTQVASTGPPVRNTLAMAYDRARGRTVLFGGYTYDGSNNIFYGDTWEWDGAMWTQLGSTGPAPRDVHAMAYDIARRRTVLFGGSGASTFADTWEYHTVGGSCSVDSDCESNHCVNGNCCDTACPTGSCAGGICNATPDAAIPDAEVGDAETPDALAPDAIVVDAATPDALGPDAIVVDAPARDAQPDGRNPDASPAAGDSSGGCGCHVGGASPPFGAILIVNIATLALFVWSRSRRRLGIVVLLVTATRAGFTGGESSASGAHCTLRPNSHDGR